MGTIAAGKAADLVIFPSRGEDPLRHVLEDPVLPLEVWATGQKHFPPVA